MNFFLNYYFIFKFLDVFYISRTRGFIFRKTAVYTTAFIKINPSVSKHVKGIKM